MYSECQREKVARATRLRRSRTSRARGNALHSSTRAPLANSRVVRPPPAAPAALAPAGDCANRSAAARPAASSTWWARFCWPEPPGRFCWLVVRRSGAPTR